MNIEILTLGHELLDGRRIDTNVSWLGRQCSLMGLAPRFHQSVGDRVKDIVSAMELACSRSELVLCTGGLGPTQDDLTFEALATTIGKELVFHPEVFSLIEERYARRNLPCPESNRRQAMLPEGACVLSNPLGTAPGVRISHQSSHIFCMPGVPSEMKAMFESFVRPFVMKALGDDQRYVERTYQFSGVPESALEEKIQSLDVADLPVEKVEIAYTASFPRVHVTFALWPKRHDQVPEIELMLDQEIDRKLAPNWVAVGNVELVDQLIHFFAEKKWTISMAESITGGSLASSFVDVAGASRVFQQSWVTYSNESKINELGVREQTLHKYGAVSRECALEMAQGAQNMAHSDLAIGITGVAGPGGATEQKPLGLTY
ncbi:MAG: CinA family nicotinamide mononucleotide deamidase-related protein, partial [Bdellovibrionales bacterium]|nr:CinA family nicotinamide mononucleotide deamidase-related protein [Bdellovibrionales bacterium]